MIDHLLPVRKDTAEALTDLAGGDDLLLRDLATAAIDSYLAQRRRRLWYVLGILGSLALLFTA